MKSEYIILRWAIKKKKDEVIGVDPNPVCLGLSQEEKRDTNPEGRVTTEAETGVMGLKAKDCQPLTGAESAGRNLPRVAGGPWPC